MHAIKNKDIADYVSGLSEFQKELVLKIREIVLSVDDRIQEGIKWGSIAFFNQKNICGYRLAKAHVTLLFMEGSSLNDKYDILKGSGPKARTIKVTKLEEIHAEGIKDLIKLSLSNGM